MFTPVGLELIVPHTMLEAGDTSVKEGHELIVLPPIGLESHLQGGDEIVEKERLFTALDRLLADDGCVGIFFPEDLE